MLDKIEMTMLERKQLGSHTRNTPEFDDLFQIEMNSSPQDFDALVMAIRLVMAKWAVCKWILW